MDYIDTHADDAVARLLMQYKGTANREGLIRALASEVQALEDVLQGVYTLRTLGAATGVQLDELGVLVGIGRNGHTDEDFRTYLAAQMLLNRSSGAPEEILAIFSLIAGGNPLALLEQFPAALALQVGGPITNPGELADILQQAKDGGVRAILEWLATDPGDSFTLVDTSAAGTDSATGCGDSSDPTTGGQFAGAME